MTKLPSSVFDTVTLSTGDQVHLSMPKVGNVIPIILSGGASSGLQVAIEAITGKPWEWFLELPLLDGTLIIERATPALKAVMEIMTIIGNIHSNPTTKH